MSPTNSKTGSANLRIASRLDVWNEQSQLGTAFDSSTGFTLPDGSMRSPDASWMTLEKWQRLTEEEKESFAPVCPDFVLELKSKTDRLADLQEKMESWLANGAQLGWLVVLEEETVYIYQPGEPVGQYSTFSTPLSGDPVLSGFRLDFSKLRLP